MNCTNVLFDLHCQAEFLEPYTSGKCTDTACWWCRADVRVCVVRDAPRRGDAGTCGQVDGASVLVIDAETVSCQMCAGVCFVFTEGVKIRGTLGA